MTPEQSYSVVSLLNDIKKLLEKQESDFKREKIQIEEAQKKALENEHTKYQEVLEQEFLRKHFTICPKIE